MLVVSVLVALTASPPARISRGASSRVRMSAGGLESFREREFAKTRDALSSNLGAQNSALQLALEQSRERAAGLLASNTRLEGEVATLAGELRAAAGPQQASAASLAELSSHVSSLKAQLAAARREADESKAQASAELARLAETLGEGTARAEAALEQAALQLAAETAARVHVEAALERTATKLTAEMSARQEAEGVVQELAQSLVAQQELALSSGAPGPRGRPRAPGADAGPLARAKAAAKRPLSAAAAAAGFSAAEVLRLRSAFTSFDSDGNGVLDECELVKVFESLGYEFSAAELKRITALYDTNRDGAISFQEFLALCSSMP